MGCVGEWGEERGLRNKVASGTSSWQFVPSSSPNLIVRRNQFGAAVSVWRRTL